MFRKNSTQQITLEDPVLALSKYLRQNLEKSWASPFNKYVFSKTQVTQMQPIVRNIKVT